MAGHGKSSGNSIWNRRFITIFIINLLFNISLYMVNTLVPKVTAFLEAPVTVIGMVVSTFAVTSLMARPFVGVSSSVFQSKSILCVSAAVLVAAYGLFALAHSIPVVIAARLLQGIGTAFVGPTCLALASNSLPPNRIASGIAIFSIGQAASNAFGPSIGLYLTERFGYNPAFSVGTLLMMLSVILALTLKNEKSPEKRQVCLSLKRFLAREALIPALLFFFLGGSYSCVVSYVVLYGESCGVENCGLFFTAYAVFVVLSRLFSGRIGEKYGMSVVIIPGIICYALSFYVISVSHSTAMFLFAGAFSALGYGTCQPSIQAMCMMQVSGEKRSTAANTCYFGVDVGYLVLPPIAGLIIASAQRQTGSITQGYIAMYRIMPVFIIMALAIFLIYAKHLRNSRISV